MKSLIIIGCILCISCGLKAQTRQQKEDSIKTEKTLISDFSVENFVLNDNIFSIYSRPEEEIQEFFSHFSPVIIPEYFVFGALGSKKLQQETDVLINEKVLHNQINHPFVVYMRDYISHFLDMQVSVYKNNNGVISFYSPELSQIINDFFDKETGDLKFDLFDTNEKICSYLLGVYYNCGRKTNEKSLLEDLYKNGRKENVTIYEINIFEIGIDRLFSLLRKVYSNNILYSSTTIRGAVPGGTSLFFEPSVYLENYFKEIEPEKQKTEKNRMDYEKD